MPTLTKTKGGVEVIDGLSTMTLEQGSLTITKKESNYEHYFGSIAAVKEGLQLDEWTPTHTGLGAFSMWFLDSHMATDGTEQHLKSLFERWLELPYEEKEGQNG